MSVSQVTSLKAELEGQKPAVDKTVQLLAYNQTRQGIVLKLENM